MQCHVNFRCMAKWTTCACMRAKSLQLCPTLCLPMDCSSPGSSVHGDSPGKNTRMGCYFLLQGIFLTEGSNPRPLHLLHWQAGSLPLCHLGSPNQLYMYIYQLFFRLFSHIGHYRVLSEVLCAIQLVLISYLFYI